MDVHIGEMNNTVRATDSQTWLNSQLLDRIARAVAEWLQAEQKRQETAEADRRLRPGVFGDETQVRVG
jgi:hypothetical protein